MRALDLSPISEVPFWRRLSPSEADIINAVCAAPNIGALGLSGDWIRAAFRTHVCGLGDVSVVGVVRPPFAICDVHTGRDTFASLTHLPTGGTVGTFSRPSEAATAADLVGPLAEWETVTVETGAGLADAVMETFEGAGFAYFHAPVGSLLIPVWRRGALH